jgi:hypothetical protein
MQLVGGGDGGVFSTAMVMSLLLLLSDARGVNNLTCVSRDIDIFCRN